jgi:integrase
MPQPWKHPKLGTYYYRKVVPAHLRAIIGKTEIRIPLSKDPREAKRLYPDAATKAEAMLSQAAGGRVHLSHQQIIALTGLWYSRSLKAHEAEPGDPDEHDLILGYLEDANDEGEGFRRGTVAKVLAEDVDGLLASEALNIDAASRASLEERMFWLKVELHQTLIRRARGDYRPPDTKLDTFPTWEPPRSPDAPRKPSGLTFTSLLDAWKIERKPNSKTKYEWYRIMGLLADRLGHDDPTRVTKADIVGWKAALLASGKSPKTVGNHLMAAAALFAQAIRNDQMTVNPAKGVTLRGDKGATKRLPYTDEDAKALLVAARGETGARRWVPWLLAFTGARLEEICQSLVGDVRSEGGIPYLDINADDPGKSLKNAGSARRVPLHPAIIAEGFIEYVKGLPSKPGGDKDSPLFPDMAPDVFGRRGGNATKIIGRWVRRQGITDPRKAPNHSWRHRFKDVCRNAGVEKSVHDALTGHTSGEVGDKYGLGYSLPTLAAAVGKLPSPAYLEERNDG